MKTLLIVLLLCATNAFAQAPDSLDGKVLHEIGGDNLRRTWDFITSLQAGGRCSFLLYSIGNQLSNHGITELNDPGDDGTWSYQRTGAATGTLRIANAKGESDSLMLAFTSPTAGRAIISGGGFTRGNGSSDFTLTDKSSANAAPFVNLSLRGIVTPGHPLIAGFVVPGVDRRDLLIRVVGPSLGKFGVSGTWADPEFKLFAPLTPAGNVALGAAASPYYGNWLPSPAINKLFAAVGAFPLDEGSKDAVSTAGVYPGACTVVCTAVAGDPGGEVLIEVYSMP